MQHARAITRKSASNLALAFVLLPREKRDAMSALYAFCREIDDVADDESIPVENRRRELARWRADIGLACDLVGRGLRAEPLDPASVNRSAPEAQPARESVTNPSSIIHHPSVPLFPVNRDLLPFLAQCPLPYSLFDELIRGVEMDLDIKRYETFEDL